MDKEKLKKALKEIKENKRCFDMMIHRGVEKCTECGKARDEFVVFCQDHDEYKKTGLSDDSHLVCVVCILQALSMMTSKIRYL